MIELRYYRDCLLGGGQITAEEALALSDLTPEQDKELWEIATEVTAKYADGEFDSCSIVNARSGRCPENCKWCAQSAHYSTKIECHPLISRDDCLRAADINRKQAIKRFSLVTSGRKLGRAELDAACGLYREMSVKGGLKFCASMGLLDREDLQKLYDSGVTRYHCNLEAAPSFFPTLCSTHTVEDKITTILAAKEIGFEVCSGGIIGMGESRRQRIELALELRRVDPASIPINILCPIPGTPLESAQPLSEEEIITTLALFRLIHPRPVLRFAGGRTKLSADAQLLALKIAMNGAIMGDMLTTIGSQVSQDKEMIAKSGYKF